MDITTMSAVELKALAYDQIAIKESAEYNLRKINEEISKRNVPIEEASFGDGEKEEAPVEASEVEVEQVTE